MRKAIRALSPPSDLTANIHHLETPQRFLFIASVGNPAPYTKTRHSAGHILIDAVTPLLHTRAPYLSLYSGTFVEPYRSRTYMNESGPKLLRTYKTWSEARKALVRKRELPIFTSKEQLEKFKNPPDPAPSISEFIDQCAPEASIKDTLDSWPRMNQFRPTLVILHDELEADLGKVRVKRGGAEKASLRGHRGLMSIFQSFRKGDLYPPRPSTGNHLSVLRIGIGIGRPDSRDSKAVADYVLGEMRKGELEAVRAAADPVVDVLIKELYRKGDEEP